MRSRFVFSTFVIAAAAASTLALTEDQRKYEYAIVLANGSTHSFGSWNSNELKNLDAGSGADRIIVRKDGKVYGITDAQTVKAAKRAIEPMMELGKQQGALGRKQGELGKRQGELGKQMGELGRKQGELSRKLGEAMRERPSQGEKEARKDYDTQMKALGNQMKALGDQMGNLGKAQGALGKQQGELGKRQGEAGKKADAEITRLIDNAFEKGLAREIR